MDYSKCGGLTTSAISRRVRNGQTGEFGIDLLRTLAASPHLIDVILVLTVAEATIVVLLRGLSLSGVLRILLPGVFLLLAVRSGLAGEPWPWVPAALAVALVAHLVDLRARWRR